MPEFDPKTENLYAQELREIQESMGLDGPSMAAVLGLKVPSYRSYLYGHRPVPEDVITAARAAQQSDRQFMTRLVAGVAARYPLGIKSELDPDYR